MSGAWLCAPWRENLSTANSAPRYLFFLTLLVAPLFCRDLKAGEQPCSHRIILVSVTDDKGRFAEGLTAASFVGKCRGKPVRILGASRDVSSRRIVILLDTSGSMTEPRGNL